eukprot:TRINITY_DN10325_c0_g1_i1.p1 TRINITY_DN10325_c0_g1~~TRINITY_DN10325_c0_g1_i1.p1  ORF type:complete len:948 (+),score=155.05 TRINITY_DN10325_c0_g1_i1:1300-4143(+)
MPFVATIEFLVSFLKLRNIDLLQQGLYRVSVGVKMEQGDKEAAVPIAMYCNDPSGRRGQWQDANHPTYPDRFIDSENKTFCTRTFFVRFQEQIEVLDEVAHFRVECDAMQVVRTWGDNVVFTFDLWHCSKEDAEKVPTECYQRKVDDRWETYSDTAYTTIIKAISKGKRVIQFKHHGMKLTMSVEGDVIKELPSEECPEGREVRIAPRAIPSSAFTKVASRSIPLRNGIMPHTEWVPVMWPDWFAACCQVLVHSSIVAFEYRPDGPDSNYTLGNKAFKQAIRQGSNTNIDSDDKCFSAAVDTFHVLSSYLIYAYYYTVEWLQALIGDGFETPRGALEKLRDRMSYMNERFNALSALGNIKGPVTHADPNSTNESIATREESDTDDTSNPDFDRGMVLPCVVPGEAVGSTQSTTVIKPELCSLLKRYDILDSVIDPPLAVDLCHPCDIDMFHDAKTIPTDVLSCFSNGVSHELDEIIGLTRRVTAHYTTQFSTSIPETAEQVGMEEACAITCASMLTSLSAEVQDIWCNLVHRAIPQGAPVMMSGAKRAYWRNETLRSRRCISSQPPQVKDTPKTATIKEAPSVVPPYLPLTFSYPQHTFVEFQLLSLGVPSGTLIGEGRGDCRKASQKQGAKVVESEAGWSDDEEAAGSPHGHVDPLVDKLVNKTSTFIAKEKVTDTGGTVHLIVFCHGYKGNQYDLRALRNHMALSLSVGVEFLVAKSVEDQSDEELQKLGEIFAHEVSNHIREENLKLRKLSFVGHSMGGVLIRAALQSKLMEPYLPLLYTYVSLSSPHLGVADAESMRVSGALWVLSNLRQSANIKQLRLDQPGLHSLSCTDKMGLFTNVVFLSSEDDNYVSRQSATVDCETHSLLANRSTQKAGLVADMLRNMSMHLSLCDNVLRFNVRFHPVGRQELSTTMERAVGKSVHVAFLSNPDFIHSFVCLFRQYFC